MNRSIIAIIFLAFKTEADTLNLKESIKLALMNNKTIIQESNYNLRLKKLERDVVYKEYRPRFDTNFLREKIKTRKKIEFEEIATEINTETKRDNWDVGGYLSYVFSNGIKFNSELKNQIAYDRISDKYQSSIQGSFELPLSLTKGRRLENLLPLKSADEGYQLSQINYELAKQRLILECIEKYFALYKANRNVELAKEQVSLTKQLLKTSEAKFKLGEISEVDKMQVEVELALHEDELRLYIFQKESAVKEFLRIIGISNQREDIAINEQLPLFPEVKYELKECVKEGLKNRLEIKAQEIALSQQKRNIILTKTKNKPNISFILQDKYLSKEEKELEQVIKEYPDREWTIKFTVSYSFYDSSKTKKEVEKAYVSYEMEKERLERQKEDIENEISLIYNEESSLKHRLKNLEINLGLAHKTLQMNQKKYELGKISSREVIESQLSYRNLKSSYEDVNIDFIINQLRLLKAMGISLEKKTLYLLDGRLEDR